MKRTIVSIAVTAATLIGSGTAHALQLDTTDSRPLSAWAARSYAPLAPVAIRVERGGCFDGTSQSCTSPDITPYTIWLASDANRGDLMHELGHIFDYTVMTDRARDEFRRLIQDSRPWRSAANSPHEKFAEAYKFCALHRKIRTAVEEGYAYVAGPKRHRRVCRMIRLAAAGYYGRP